LARFQVSVASGERTAKFLWSIWSEPSGEVRVRVAWANGEMGVVITGSDEPIPTPVLEVAGGLLRTVRLVANPKKPAGVRAAETPQKPGIPRAAVPPPACAGAAPPGE